LRNYFDRLAKRRKGRETYGKQAERLLAEKKLEVDFFKDTLQQGEARRQKTNTG